MNRKRLKKIEQELGEGLPSVGIIFREKDDSGNVTEHTQNIKSYNGHPAVIKSDDYEL